AATTRARPSQTAHQSSLSHSSRQPVDCGRSRSAGIEPCDAFMWASGYLCLNDARYERRHARSGGISLRVAGCGSPITYRHELIVKGYQAVPYERIVFLASKSALSLTGHRVALGAACAAQ